MELQGYTSNVFIRIFIKLNNAKSVYLITFLASGSSVLALSSSSSVSDSFSSARTSLNETLSEGVVSVFHEIR